MFVGRVVFTVVSYLLIVRLQRSDAVREALCDGCGARWTVGAGAGASPGTIGHERQQATPA